MGKFVVRITIVFTALYMIVSYILAQIYGLDVLRYSYTLLFELCTVLFTFSSGKYHCKYIKWTMLSIFLADCITHYDHYFNVFTVKAHNLIPIYLIFFGIAVPFVLALNHFYKVNKLKNERRKIFVSNQESSVSIT